MRKPSAAREAAIKAETVRHLFDYSPETGAFVRKVSVANNARAGDVAGRRTTKCVQIGIDGVPFNANRLAWLYMTGKWPDRQVCHRDRDGFNNAWANLREADTREYSGNRRVRRDSASGVKGVFKVGRKWRATIQRGGRRDDLGRHDTREAAAAAFAAAHREIYGELSRTA